jgi:hypothetical protein
VTDASARLTVISLGTMIPLAPIPLRPAKEFIRAETVLTFLVACLRMKVDMASIDDLAAKSLIHE